MQPHGDLPADIDDLIRFGVVLSLEGTRAVVACGDITSPAIPWLSFAGGFRSYVPLSVGEQVAILCPSGDIAGAIILGGLYSDANPPPSSGLRATFKCPDGTVFDYDADAHALTVTLVATGKVIAPGGLEIDGDVTINGKLSTTDDVTVTGKLTASDDVIGGGIHLKTHTHGLVKAGTDSSGGPQ